MGELELFLSQVDCVSTRPTCQIHLQRGLDCKAYMVSGQIPKVTPLVSSPHSKLGYVPVLLPQCLRKSWGEVQSHFCSWQDSPSKTSLFQNIPLGGATFDECAAQCEGCSCPILMLLCSFPGVIPHRPANPPLYHNFCFPRN